MEIDIKAMGEKLVHLRGKKTQDEVARDLNISKSALSMYESGKRVPRDPLKARISSYYGETILFIFFNQKEHET